MMYRSLARGLAPCFSAMSSVPLDVNATRVRSVRYVARRLRAVATAESMTPADMKRAAMAEKYMLLNGFMV